MKLSVLLPVYNAGLPLKRAIESILNQSHRDFEFIIIDDASTDKSKEIIDYYCSIDERIRPVYHSTNMGLAYTLNEGIKLSKYDLITRMDQDDESLPDRLKIQHEYMKKKNEIVVAGSLVYHMGISKEYDRLISLPTETEEVKKHLYKYNCIYHPSVVMRKKEILEIGGYRSEFKNAEDYDLWLRVSKKYKLANIDKPLLRYRFSIKGMTLSKKWEQFYFVNLALAANSHSELSLKESERLVQERFSRLDKEAFLRNVYAKTLRELIILGFWIDGINFIKSYFLNIGVISGFKLLIHIFKMLLTSRMRALWNTSLSI